MKAILERCSFQRLYSLHESLTRAAQCLTGELQRPTHFSSPSGEVIAACREQLSDCLEDVEKEMARRPLRSYEDAAMLFTIKAGYVRESPDEHYAEVLKLLEHSRAKCA